MNRALLALLTVIPALVIAQGEPAPAPRAAPAAKAAPAAQAPAAVQVEAKACAGVEDKEAVGPGDKFPATVGKVYVWTKVTGAAGGEVTHVWYHAGKKVNEVKLPLKYASVRTWSFKTIVPEAAGEWKVEVVGADGQVLATVPFQIAG